MSDQLKKSKAFVLFSCISTRERAGFIRFIGNDFLMGRSQVKEVFHLFEKNAGKILVEDYSRARFYKDLLGSPVPGAKKVNQELNKAMNYFSVAVKNFWFFQLRYEKEEKKYAFPEWIRYKLTLLRILLDKGALNEFKFERKKLVGRMEEHGPDSRVLLARLELYELENAYEQRVHPGKHRPGLEEAEQVLKQFFVRELFRLRASRRNQYEITGFGEAVEAPEETLCLSEWVDLDTETRLFRTYLELETNSQLGDWNLAQDSILLDLESAGVETRREILLLLLSFAVRALRKKTDSRDMLVNGLWDIYKILITEGLLEDHGVINPRHLVNLIQLGVYREEGSFLLDFTKQYASNLNPGNEGGSAVPQATLHLMDGYLQMANKNWKDAELAMLKVYYHTNFQIEDLLSRANLMRILFELGNFQEILDEEAGRNRVKVRRAINSNLPVKNIGNFILLVKRLVEIVLAAPTAKRERQVIRLEKDITVIDELMYRDWLLEKLNEEKKKGGRDGPPSC